MYIAAIIFAIVAFYYFNKFTESEKEYFKLNSYLKDLRYENQLLKVKLNEMASYKQDVSKTLGILETELGNISRRLPAQQSSDQTTSPSATVQNVVPGLLQTLFSGNFNQEPIRIYESFTLTPNQRSRIRQQTPTQRLQPAQSIQEQPPQSQTEPQTELHTELQPQTQELQPQTQEQQEPQDPQPQEPLQESGPQTPQSQLQEQVQEPGHPQPQTRFTVPETEIRRMLQSQIPTNTLDGLSVTDTDYARYLLSSVQRQL
ncbi:hypothetical protein EB077_01790 [bacterium]|nr:hypothetical protein [bacterium]